MNKSKFGFGERKKGTYYMGEPWISQIMDGTKTIDVRIGKASNYEEFLGKEVIYFHKDKQVKVKYEKINHYESLKELLKNEDRIKMAPHTKSDKEYLEVMHKFYTDERVDEAGGVNAIHIKLV